MSNKKINTINPELPSLSAIVAMSVDGKISIASDKPARFSSKADLEHLESKISEYDAIIFGGNTLRAYGTSLVIKNPYLLAKRQKKNQPLQPLNIVCSPSGNIPPDIPFFSQPLHRGLLTTNRGLIYWQEQIKTFNSENNASFFEQIFTFDYPFNWQDILKKIYALNYHKIAILGGSQLISSLLQENLIDDLWLTICPLIIGHKNATNLLDNNLFSSSIELKLIEVKQIKEELFLHYLIKKPN
ncbi:RibD family protein [Geminocystis sp. CENA526]|uniref:RibD family protein n=1 Tax=Geminocystis sp. CENA526 TaxID=1355871 RepID=UPI003D6DAF09